MENRIFEYIIIGAGYGGLTAGALLANEGIDILMLEAHSAPGGCASFFKRDNFTFDAGATTLSGMEPHQPVGSLFSKLKINPVLKKIDPGMIIKTGDKELVRYSNHDSWLNEVTSVFHGKGQKLFWNDIKIISEKAWQLIGNNFNLPPRTAGDILSLAKLNNLRFLPLSRYLFNPVSSLIKSYKLNEDPEFLKFIKEQLFITVQNTPEDTPALTAAMGLNYASEIYYPYGGIYKPAAMLADKIASSGGQILYNSKAVKVELKDGYYEVQTKNGQVYKSMGLISNIPFWNLATVTTGEHQKYFRELTRKISTAPGAFTVYFGIESSESLQSLYYQVYLSEKIPFIKSKSMFVSFSAEDDAEKAPAGWRTVTISLHTEPDFWASAGDDEYKLRKLIVTSRVMEEFNQAFPIFNLRGKKHLLSGTPGTFEQFTGRYKGYTGGIPHSVTNLLTGMSANVTPFKNFYLTGDTAFPGQGIPSVIYGAQKVVNKILS